MSIVISSDIDGGPPVPAAGVQIIVNGEVEGAMNAVGRLVETAWKRNAPVRTGTYRRSIHHETTQIGDRTVGEIKSDLSYAPALEMGTGEFGPLRRAIRKHPGAFRFKNRGAGVTRYGRTFPPPYPPTVRAVAPGAPAQVSPYIYTKVIRGIVPFHSAEKAYAETYLAVREEMRKAGHDAAEQIARATHSGSFPFGGGIQLRRPGGQFGSVGN